MKEKIQAFLSNAKTQFLSYFGRISAPAFILAGIAGIVFLIVKFKDLLISYYVNSSKKEVDNASKEDAQLKAKEDSLKAQADALEKQADNLPSQEKPIDENWNKRK